MFECFLDSLFRAVKRGDTAELVAILKSNSDSLVNCKDEVQWEHNKKSFLIRSNYCCCCDISMDAPCFIMPAPWDSCPLWRPYWQEALTKTAGIR